MHVHVSTMAVVWVCCSSFGKKVVGLGQMFSLSSSGCREDDIARKSQPVVQTPQFGLVDMSES